MKKIVILTIALLLASLQLVSAQNKGDFFISPVISCDLGLSNGSLKNSGYSEKLLRVYDPSFSIGAEFGFFPVNNLKLALSLGYGLSIDRYFSTTNEKLSNVTNMFDINPNIAYYVKLADRIYYAPEVGAVIGVGSYSEALSSSSKYTYGDMSYGAYIQPINFEFRIHDHWAIGTGFGQLQYYCNVLKNRENGNKVLSNIYSFDLSSTIWCRFYL